MFIFTWLDSNTHKADLTVNGVKNALTIYNILHDNVKAHALRCLMKEDDVESYVVFINGCLVKV